MRRARFVLRLTDAARFLKILKRCFHSIGKRPLLHHKILFSALSPHHRSHSRTGKPISLSEKLAWEKELLGIYVSGHPLDAHETCSQKQSSRLRKLKKNPRTGMPVILPVLVITVRTILTKSGEKMAFVKLDDKTDSIEAVIFPKLFKVHASAIVSGACLLVKGKSQSGTARPRSRLKNSKALICAIFYGYG